MRYNAVQTPQLTAIFTQLFKDFRTFVIMRAGWASVHSCCISRMLLSNLCQEVLRLRFKGSHGVSVSSNKAIVYQSNQQGRRVYHSVFIVGSNNLRKSLDSGTCCVQLLQCANHISLSACCSNAPTQAKHHTEQQSLCQSSKQGLAKGRLQRSHTRHHQLQATCSAVSIVCACFHL